MRIFLVSSTLGRCIIVLTVLVAVSAPIGFMAWRSKEQSADQLLKNARDQQEAGKKKQAKAAYDRAVKASKTPQERHATLRKVAASYRDADAASPLEALENYTAAIAAESKILRDNPEDSSASENTLNYYVGMLEAFGPSAINLEGAIHLAGEKLKTDPANIAAAKLMIRSQITLWRRQSQTPPSKSVIQQRIQPAAFCLKKSLRPCVELITYLHHSTSEDATGRENRAYANEIVNDFTGEPSAIALVETLKTMLEQEVGADFSVLEKSTEDAIKQAGTISTPQTAVSWLAIIAQDRRLTWDGQDIQATGDLAAKRFADALPATIAEHSELELGLIRIDWRLGFPNARLKVDALVAKPLSLRAELASLANWSKSLEAATLKAEMLLSDDLPTEAKNAELDDLSKKFGGSLGGEALQERIELMKQLANHWYFSAGSKLLERGKSGDHNALFWAAMSMRAAGAQDAAYPLMRTIVERGSQMRLPGRYIWKLMGLLTQYETQNGQPKFATARLAALAASTTEHSPITEAHLSSKLIELLILAKQGKAKKASEEFAALQNQLSQDGFRDSASLQATSAALLVEIGQSAKAIKMLEKTPISSTTIAIWPGIENGHFKEWSTLKQRLKAEYAEHKDAAIQKVAQQMLGRSDVSRRELIALHETAARTTSTNQAQLLSLQIALGHWTEANELLQAASQQSPKPAWLPEHQLTMAMRRGDWNSVFTGLSNPATSERIDPVHRSYLEAAILTRQGKTDAATKIVDAQLKNCEFHQELWLLKGKLVETTGDPAEAQQAYTKAASLNRASQAATSALYRNLQSQGNHTAAAQLLAARHLQVGNLAALASQPTSSGGIDTSALASALEAERAKGQLAPQLELQLMTLQWRLGRKADAQSTAATILKKYPTRLSFVLPALGYRSDPEATEVLNEYRKKANRQLEAQELLAMAQFWRIRGYLKKEGELLTEAIDTGNSPAAIRRKADWHGRTGNPEHGLELLEQEWQRQPSIATGLQLAEIAIAVKKRKRALAILEELTRENHGLARVDLLKAFIQYPDQPQISSKIATTYIQSQPEDPWGWYYRAKMQENDPEAASRIPKDLQQALKLAPEMEPARIMLADWMLKHGDAVGASTLLEAGGQYSPGSQKMGIAEIVAKIRDLDGTGACQSADSLLTRFPRVALVQRLAVYTFLKFGRYYRALPLAEQFLADSPDSIIELNNAAHLLAVTGENPERAHTLITKAINLVKADSPYRPYLEDTRTLVQVCGGQFETAIADVPDLHAPHQPAHCLYLAAACAKLGRMDGAKKLVAAADAADSKLKQSEEWYLSLADLSQYLPKEAGKLLLPTFQQAATTVEEDTGSIEISARVFAGLAASQIAAGEQRAAILATLRRSSSYAKNPWAAVCRATIIARDGDPAKTAAAISSARDLLAANPILVLEKQLADLRAGQK